MNVVIVYSNQWIVFALHNLYSMDMDRGNWNYYNCRRFGHLARNYKNRRTGGRIREERRLEYSNRNNEKRRIIKYGQDSNLNGDGGLIVLN